ncbi:NAD(P)-dependent oxidoreductase [uncultured Selenomonas sp.]|uniref:NAD-dependent epimerase/dehydratase family protein n=1 Tax=uncultured Selenomonas sp. TaxID=159275 RepID=UPI0025D42DC0|nr:NAD-dependent epimerase/dehydratase family protein [uncultured Selenomonas sp.]
MNILLTGATGFIGSNLLLHIPEDCRCYALVRPTTDISHLQCADIHVFDGDVDALASFLREKKISGILHLASLYLSSHRSEDVAPLVSSNVTFGASVLEAAAKSDVRWFLNTGTIWQNYEAEGMEYHPVNLYAATKEAFISVARYYVEACGLRFCTLKLTDTYGPHDPRRKIFALFREIAESGETLAMSPGEQQMDILYIDDVVRGFWQLASMMERGDESLAPEYRLGSGHLRSLQELARIFSETVGRPLHITWGGRPYRKREVMHPWQEGEILPRWQAKVSLREGILKMMKDCAES